MLGRFQISSKEKEVITQMLSYCNIVDLNSQIKQLAIGLKQKYHIKLPDALIAATAMQQNLTLVTADKGFRKISEVDLLLITL